ncbi:MAG TPA: EcsC family protein [Ktedonobacterales bacterium]|nr:EcsC family protein [Ktedonobacterales bacterium]
MSTSSNGGQGLPNLSSGLTGAAVAALPPEIQALLKPGKTSDRIQQAIAWAARPDPRVLALHQALDPSIERFEDIARATLAHKDAVARQIARRYRHRAALTGAVTSLPGGLWAIVAAGADVQLTATYSVRMAAMIAQSYGYDTSILEEQAHLADVLALVAGIDSLRGVGNWLTREGLVHSLPQVLPRILTRLSIEITEEQAAKWVGRIIPGVGAIVGGGIDYAFLRAAGERALAYYHNRFLEDNGMLPAGTSVAALGTPKGVKQLPAPALESPRVVEGSLVSPTSEAARVAALPPAGPAAQTLHASAAAATPAPVKRRSRPPERFAVYLAIFAVLALGITIAACAALAIIVQQNFFQ